jgi:hypothetical protein
MTPETFGLFWNAAAGMALIFYLAAALHFIRRMIPRAVTLLLLGSIFTLIASTMLASVPPDFAWSYFDAQDPLTVTSAVMLAILWFGFLWAVLRHDRGED